MKRVVSIILAIVFVFSAGATAEVAGLSIGSCEVYAADISGTCGENVSYTLSGSTEKGYKLTIEGNGAMDNYNYNAPWSDYRASITKVVVNSGVTTIGAYAFYGCTALESVSLPNTLTSIGKQAFGICWSLTSLTIPEGVTSIGVGAFANCCGLRSLSLPSTVTSIGKSAFYYCEKLTKITIPEGVTSLDAKVFEYSESLYTINYAKKGVTIASIKGTKSGFTVKYNLQTKLADGYQIQYSTNKNFKNAKTVTVKNLDTLAKTIKKLKSQKTYYVRVRTYQAYTIHTNSSGTHTRYLYSAWSSRKSVKTK